MVADVDNIQAQVIVDGPLDVETPLGHVRRTQVGDNSVNFAWPRSYKVRSPRERIAIATGRTSDAGIQSRLAGYRLSGIEVSPSVIDGSELRRTRKREGLEVDIAACRQ